jgi:hypothetical protein
MTETAATPKKRTATYLEARFQIQNIVILIPQYFYIISIELTLQSRKCQESFRILSNFWPPGIVLTNI